MAQLLVNSPDKPQIVHELAGAVVLGRGGGDRNVDLVVPDTKVSRCHCQVFSEGPAWIVEDLGSSNGTRINGTVRKRHALRDGDRIEIGHTVVTYKADPPKTFAAPTRSAARDRLKKRARS